MKDFVKIAMILFACIGFASSSHSQDTIIRYKKPIVPNYVNFQYAGNYGAYIVGAGYYLNKKQNIELNLGFGYSSKHKAAYRIYNVFAKGIYLPHTWKAKHKWSFSPQLGLTISRQFSGGANTFTRLPKTYPEGYYAPNAFRVHFNLGGRVRKDFGDDSFVKALEFYAETTTNDLYFKYYVKSSEVSLTSIFSMALGMNIILFTKN